MKSRNIANRDSENCYSEIKENKLQPVKTKQGRYSLRRIINVCNSLISIIIVIFHVFFTFQLFFFSGAYTKGSLKWNQRVLIAILYLEENNGHLGIIIVSLLFGGMGMDLKS